MAKKRKSSSRHPDVSDGPDMNVGESRKRIRDYEDVADSDDEFHINRDKVLLDEEPEAKRRRKWQEQELRPPILLCKRRIRHDGAKHSRLHYLPRTG